MTQALEVNVLSSRYSAQSSWLVLCTLVWILCSGSDANVLSQEMQVATEKSTVVFNFVPPYGSFENLIGRVHNVDPHDYKVAVYIFVEGGGWWTKPTFAEPLTPIQSDSTWLTDITTGGSDAYATKIHAFLLPHGVDPPQSGGLPCLPASLDTIAVADVLAERNPKTISFSGYEWWVKTSAAPVGPGPNYFSDSTENVWVDAQNRLHLKIANRNGIWYCGEVVLKGSFGYGTYVFKLTGKIGEINENTVLGLFTWDNDACTEFYREIDIEFSGWGVVTDSNAQYVMQPFDLPGNRYGWMLPSSLEASTHSFDWTPDHISFLSVKGHRFPAQNDSVIDAWKYKSPTLPIPGNENIRTNLWLVGGQPPTDYAEVEVIIAQFEYVDLSTSVDEENVVYVTRYCLSQNHPNPFNPLTTIAYDLPKASDVTLTIYAVTGQHITKLVSDHQEAGHYEVAWDGSGFATGIYFYRLEAGQFAATKRMLLLR